MIYIFQTKVFFIIYNSKIYPSGVYDTGHGKCGKSWNLKNANSRRGCEVVDFEIKSLKIMEYKNKS